MVLRVTLGVVMIAHGVQKLTTAGFGGIGDAFASMGVPGAAVAGPLVLLLEVFGGIAMVIGLGTSIIGALDALTMFGAIVFVHASYGFFVQNGGYELTLALAVLSAFFAVVGAGRYSVDHYLLPRVVRRGQPAAV